MYLTEDELRSVLPGAGSLSATTAAELVRSARWQSYSDQASAAATALICKLAYERIVTRATEDAFDRWMERIESDRIDQIHGNQRYRVSCRCRGVKKGEVVAVNAVGEIVPVTKRDGVVGTVLEDGMVMVSGRGFRMVLEP